MCVLERANGSHKTHYCDYTRTKHGKKYFCFTDKIQKKAYIHARRKLVISIHLWFLEVDCTAELSKIRSSCGNNRLYNS